MARSSSTAAARATERMTQREARRGAAEAAADAVESPAERRARLRVADRADRPRRITPFAVIITLMVCAVVFGALSVQISLIHRQQKLDSLRADITETQLKNKELRESESKLQAPAEILRIARDELGMVESRSPELVTPEVETVAAETDPALLPQATPTTAPATDPNADAPASDG